MDLTRNPATSGGTSTIKEYIVISGWVRLAVDAGGRKKGRVSGKPTTLERYFEICIQKKMIFGLNMQARLSMELA